MKNLPVIILFLNALIGISQTENPKGILITGTVISEVNNKPLKDVFISVNSTGEISNKNGTFELNYNDRKNDSVLTINFSKLGYETVEKVIIANKITNQSFDITLKPRFKLNREKALEDIKKGEVNILESSGIAPVFYKSDSKFAKKYNVNFVEYGCEAIAWESLYEYNRAVFEYLDHKYGKKWRKKIRKDIVGFEKENE